MGEEREGEGWPRVEKGLLVDCPQCVRNFIVMVYQSGITDGVDQKSKLRLQKVLSNSCKGKCIGRGRAGTCLLGHCGISREACVILLPWSGPESGVSWAQLTLEKKGGGEHRCRTQWRGAASGQEGQYSAWGFPLYLTFSEQPEYREVAVGPNHKEQRKAKV